MSTKTKRFSESLHSKFDAKAREKAKAFIEREYGFEVVDNPDPYGPDLMAYDGERFAGYVECEVKDVWKGRRFPFQTIQFPKRKSKFLTDAILFVMFNSKMNRCLIVDGRDLEKAKLVEVSNKYVKKGEFFYQVKANDVTFFNTEEL